MYIQETKSCLHKLIAHSFDLFDVLERNKTVCTFLKIKASDRVRDNERLECSCLCPTTDDVCSRKYNCCCSIDTDTGNHYDH